MITLLIVDDHQVVRWGLRTFLATQADMLLVGEATTGEEALTLAAEQAPNVVLLDLVMPGMHGVEVTRRLKQISPHSQIIVLTSYHEDVHIFPAIRAGALSYLLKDVDTRELAEAVRKAARGEAVLHPQIAVRLAQPTQMAGHEPGEESLDLSPREREVLHLIAEGYANTAIAEQLIISEYTVKNHVSNILSKLHLADRTQAAVYAWRHGMIDR